jgi:hypothetical protein
VSGRERGGRQQKRERDERFDVAPRSEACRPRRGREADERADCRGLGAPPRRVQSEETDEQQRRGRRHQPRRGPPRIEPAHERQIGDERRDGRSMSADGLERQQRLPGRRDPVAPHHEARDRRLERDPDSRRVVPQRDRREQEQRRSHNDERGPGSQRRWREARAFGCRCWRSGHVSRRRAHLVLRQEAHQREQESTGERGRQHLAAARSRERPPGAHHPERERQRRHGRPRRSHHEQPRQEHERDPDERHGRGF